MSKISYLRFATLELISAGIWAIAIALGGFYFGRAVEIVLEDIKSYELELLSIVAGVALVVWLIHAYRRRRDTR